MGIEVVCNGCRYSVLEMGGADEEEEDVIRLQYLGAAQRRTLSEQSTETEEDEGVEAGHGTDSSMDEGLGGVPRPPTPPLPRAGGRTWSAPTSDDELEQLEQYLRTASDISCYPEDAADWNEGELLTLRSHVSRFLALKINRQEGSGAAAGSRKTVSWGRGGPPNSPAPPPVEPPHPLAAVTSAVEQIIQHFGTARDSAELATLGDAEATPACGRLVLSTLCPALYALLGQGLKPTLDTPFGAIDNSLWQVRICYCHYLIYIHPPVCFYLIVTHYRL